MQTINVFEEDLHPAIEKVRLSRGDEVNADYQRWSLVLSMLRDGDDLLDIGIGRGQFPDAAVSTNMFGRVRGADRKQHSLYRNDNQFEYVEYDLTTPPPAELRAQVVTCLECIEHIADPAFDAAVRISSNWRWRG